MNAIDLLKKQHRLVEDLFSKFEKAKSTSEKARVFEQIASNLVGHDAIEREIFYPACEHAASGEEADEAEDILGESLVEHGLVEFSIFRADKNKSSEDLEKYVTVLKEVVEHHVKEEEKELFPKVKKLLGDELDELGDTMEARFAETQEEDFRPALKDNLQQVLNGKMKTTPKKKRAAAAKTKRAAAPRRRAGGQRRKATAKKTKRASSSAKRASR